MSLKNENGFSLVQSLISLAIAGIVMTSIVAMMGIQGREQKSLSQKLSILDLQRVLIATLSNEAVCNYQLTRPGNNHFDATLIGSNPGPIINLTKITSQASATSPSAAEVGAPASANDPLTTTRIQVRDFVDAGTTDKYRANLVVEFNANEMIRSLRPIIIQLNISTTGPLNNRQIVGCYSDSLVSDNTPAGAVMAFALATCPNGWTDYTPAQGRFLRGIDKISGIPIDPSGTRTPGHIQNQGTAVNGLGLNFGSIMTYSNNNGWGYGVNNVSFYDHPTKIVSSDPETRPVNVAVLYCIKN